ncbi:MAG: class I SAM-dependent methyltransferase [Alphaproteobacteria bacterium]|nr:class I SAM-dependent methyltransferase [Alphaproteobacteria bacterium]
MSASPKPAPGETYFGDSVVPEAAKARLVRELFARVAGRYDLMNDLMSVGLHRGWKQAMVEQLRLVPGMTVLDVAGGTGDIALRLRARARAAGIDLRLLVCDLTPGMLRAGADRAIDQGVLEGIEWIAGDAERLPLPDRAVDAVTIAFGIRNVTRIDAALAEAARVLKFGGRFLCLEFSPPPNPAIALFYERYNARVLPMLGAAVAGDRAAYRYLAESIRRFPDAGRFAGMIRAAGFGGVGVRTFAGGVVALHSGWKT